MNKKILLSKMALHEDTGGTLAEYIGISRSTFSAKINETAGAEFTQHEILAIKQRYNLTAAEVDAIFFEPEVSKLDTDGGGMEADNDTEET